MHTEKPYLTDGWQLLVGHLPILLSVYVIREKEITMEDLLTVASSMSIKKPREIIEKVIDVVAHWPEYATPLGIPLETVKTINSTLNIL